MIPEALRRIQAAREAGSTEIELGDLGLEELPPELLELKDLRRLLLGENRLRDLPAWLAELGQLEEINLGHNEFERVPAVVGRIQGLRRLLLHTNRIVEIPYWFADLARLEVLYLNWNPVADSGGLQALASRLTEFGADRPLFASLAPVLAQSEVLVVLLLSREIGAQDVKTLGRIRSLRVLRLADMVQQLLPEGVGHLAQLQQLDVSVNQLTALPESVGQLAQLRQLDLSRNQLTALPESVGRLAQLQQLAVSDNQLTALPESVGQLAQLQKLFVSANQLTVLPESVGGLAQLLQLDVSRNQLTALPERVGRLAQLVELDMSRNQLTKLPESFGRLAQLQQLDVSVNQLTALPESVGELSQLRKLDASDNKLTVLPESVGQLAQLRQLVVSGNQLSALPESVGQLTQLQQLAVLGNHLTALPEGLGQLAQLRQLDVSDNQLTVLPESVGRLAHLLQLDVSRNQLRALPESVGQLAQLRRLVVSGNQLGSLPESVGQLAQLQRLDVSRNQLKAVPDGWQKAAALSHLDLAFNALDRLPASLQALELQSLWLQGNPDLRLSGSLLGEYPSDLFTRLSEPPPRPPAGILAAYFASRSKQARELNEVKLVLVGRGSAGKTSIARRLVRNTFSRSQKETPGIDISRWTLALADREVRVNIWDFAGQVVTHSTHQFFMSENSVYVLVLTGREDTHRTDADYWLKLIRAFAADGEGAVAPVIVALNKFGEHPFRVDRVGLKERYPFIAGFVETDCKVPIGIAQLKQLLTDVVDAMPLVRQRFKAEWWRIRRAVEAEQRKANYLQYNSFQAICKRYGEADPERQRFLADVLHSLGVALNYGRDPRLRDAMVLNPRWVTEGIYTLLRKAVVDDGSAVLDLQSARKVLPAEPELMLRYLVALMQRFDLAFPLNESDDRWLVPQRLPEETPPLDGVLPDPGVPSTRLRFSYPVLPEGLLPRFIARTYPLSEGAQDGPALPRWTHGVVLMQGGACALVRVDAEERQVNITVSGEEAARLELLGVIQADFRTIHRDIQGLGASEYLEVSGAYLPVDTLIADERARNASAVWTTRGTVPVDPTVELNRLSKPLAREEHAHRVRVFISYTSANARQKDELLVRLKPLKETHGLVEVWEDRCIAPGGDWDGEVRAELERAHVVLLLVGARFLASTYIRDVEVQRAIERARAKECVVVPIILEKVDWKDEIFGWCNALPPKGRPIQAYNPRNDGWFEVGSGLRKLLEDLRASASRATVIDAKVGMFGVRSPSPMPGALAAAAVRSPASPDPTA